MCKELSDRSDTVSPERLSGVPWIFGSVERLSGVPWIFGSGDNDGRYAMHAYLVLREPAYALRGSGRQAGFALRGSGRQAGFALSGFGRQAGALAV